MSLTFDWNGEINVTGKLKQNGQDINEEISSVKNDVATIDYAVGSPSKNLFDINAFQAVLGTATRGTAEIVDNGIKITANKTDEVGKSGDAYTNPYLNSYNPYKIPVKPNTTYVFSWVADSNLQGYVYVFKNGLSSGDNGIGKDNQLLKSFSFTTNVDTTFITVRFGVTQVNKSITYTNIMIRPADITDDTYEPYVPSVAEQFATVKNDIAVNCATLGAQHKNLFNKDGDINYIYTGERPADQKWYSTVSGNVITVRAPLTLTNIVGQFIPKAKGKKIILSGKLVSINSSNSADMLAIRAYTRNVPAPIFNTRTNNIGEFSCKIDCEEYDEVFVCFGLWYGDGTAEIENIMVRYADITDDTYEAYVPSVNERLVEVENDITNINTILSNTMQSTDITITPDGVQKYVRIGATSTAVTEHLIVMQTTTGIGYATYLFRGYGEGGTVRCRITQLNGGASPSTFINDGVLYIKLFDTINTHYISVYTLQGSIPTLTVTENYAGHPLTNTLPAELEARLTALESALNITGGDE